MTSRWWLKYLTITIILLLLYYYYTITWIWTLGAIVTIYCACFQSFTSFIVWSLWKWSYVNYKPGSTHCFCVNGVERLKSCAPSVGIAPQAILPDSLKHYSQIRLDIYECRQWSQARLWFFFNEALEHRYELSIGAQCSFICAETGRLKTTRRRTLCNGGVEKVRQWTVKFWSNDSRAQRQWIWLVYSTQSNDHR